MPGKGSMASNSKQGPFPLPSHVFHVPMALQKNLVRSLYIVFSPTSFSEDWQLNGHWKQLLIFLIELRNKDADALIPGHTHREERIKDKY